MKAGNLGCTSELHIWNGFCVFWGTSFHTSPHSHTTLQVVLDIEKEFLVKDKSKDWIAYSAVIIDAGHVHQFNSNNSIQLFLYLEKDSTYAKQLQAKYLQEQPIQGLDNTVFGKRTRTFLKQLLVQNEDHPMFMACVSILNGLLDEPEQPPLDHRVAKAVTFIKQSPLKDFKVKEVARTVGLSESRLRHLFKVHIGQSIQSYIKWMRVIDALNDVLKGKKLMDTAYKYGFADASHMTKSFIDVIGIAPSKINGYEAKTKIVTSRDVHTFHLRTNLWEDWSNNEVYKKINIKSHEKSPSN